MLRRVAICGAGAMIAGAGLFVFGGMRQSLAAAHNGVVSLPMIAGAALFILGLIVLIAAFSTYLITGMAGVAKDTRHDD